ncbi:hypothetical protein PoB_002556500, partial [Plakobranchus ocellatus]
MGKLSDGEMCVCVVYEQEYWGRGKGEEGERIARSARNITGVLDGESSGKGEGTKLWVKSYVRICGRSCSQ